MKKQLQDLRTLISQSRLEDGFLILTELIDQIPDKNLKNTLLGLQKRWNQLQRKKGRGVLTHEAETTTENQLTQDLLDLLDQIETGKNGKSPQSSANKWWGWGGAAFITAALITVGGTFLLDTCNKEAKLFTYTIILEHKEGKRLHWLSETVPQLSIKQGSFSITRPLEGNELRFESAEKLGSDSVELELLDSDLYFLCQAQHSLTPNTKNRILVCEKKSIEELQAEPEQISQRPKPVVKTITLGIYCSNIEEIYLDENLVDPNGNPSRYWIKIPAESGHTLTLVGSGGKQLLQDRAIPAEEGKDVNYHCASKSFRTL